MKRITVALSLACCVLGACSEEVNTTIASAGASVLDRVVPTEFEHFSIAEGSLGYRYEHCGATVSKSHRKEWFTNDDGEVATSGRREDFDVKTLSAEKTDGHWRITESNADPKEMDMQEFETRVTECVDALHDARTRWAEREKAYEQQVDHNLKSWQAGGAPKPASAV